MILGDDDILHEEYVEEFLKFQKRNKSVDIFYTDFNMIDSNGDIIEGELFPFKFGRLTKNEIAIDALKNGFGLPTISMVYRTSLFESCKFDENNFGSNDWVFLYKDATWEEGYGLSKKLVSYRKHERSISLNRAYECNASIYYLLNYLSALHYFTIQCFKQKLIVYKSLSSMKDSVSDNIYCNFVKDDVNKNFINKLLFKLVNTKSIHFLLKKLSMMFRSDLINN